MGGLRVLHDIPETFTRHAISKPGSIDGQVEPLLGLYPDAQRAVALRASCEVVQGAHQARTTQVRRVQVRQQRPERRDVPAEYRRSPRDGLLTSTRTTRRRQLALDRRQDV